jgi:hypothetical protein
MNTTSQSQIWDLWYSRLQEINILLEHAQPPFLSVEGSNESGQRLAFAQDLEQTADRPKAHLTVQGDQVLREDL